MRDKLAKDRLPKRPLTSYFLFYQKKKKKIMSENPTLSMPEVAKLCSEMYKVDQCI